VSLLLYAITDDLPRLEPLRGVGATEVQCVTAAGLVVLASEHDAIPSLSEETMWEFERVIESVMDIGAVLPMRFGTLLATAHEVQRMLESRRGELLAKLARVRGGVELSVRGVWSQAPEPVAAESAQSGTDYLQARLGAQRQARELAERVHAQLDGFARASRDRILTRATVPLSAAFLIDRGTEEEFVRAVTALDAGLGDTELVCTGPWPPYSFVGDSVDA
jgi:hypothetical protein